jgi:hypothetical protein
MPFSQPNIAEPGSNREGATLCSTIGQGRQALKRLRYTTSI